MKTFWNEIEVVVTQHCECTKCHWIVHFNRVNFMCFTLIGIKREKSKKKDKKEIRKEKGKQKRKK